MSLTPRTKWGPYEILSLIGKGGMGEVYRARDAKLKRNVALKVLPDAFALDAGRLARFQREAEVLASLNHPNIAAIYGIEQDTLVMELVEGESPKGPLSFDDAWRIGSQIAAALEYAHDRGIVHRDLKPANVKIAPDGTVKLLDFGLAKAFAGQNDASPSSNENSPTLTIGATEAGVILGTAAYMSPEQARGKLIDKRADIWAFGVLMYELVTGRRPFKGDDVSETLASVIKDEPNWKPVPEKAQRLLRSCLEKDPRKRLRDIGDSGRLVEAVHPTIVPPRWRLGWEAAGLFAAALIVALWAPWRSTRPPDRPLMRLSVDLGPDAVAGQFTALAISPDGSRVVFPAKSPDGKQMLATRLLEETKPVVLTGTENGRDPFFSPDCKWIGFFADGKIKKTSVEGGAPVVLCSAPNGRGANWGEDGNIVAALYVVGPLSRVSSEGGTPQAVTRVHGAVTHR